MNDIIRSEKLKQHVEHLALTIGERHINLPSKLTAAGNYIKNTWYAQGYDVKSYGYVVQGLECFNYEITCEGRRSSRDLIVIGAHYDSVPGSPAANDNASGIAAMLELSQCFRVIQPAVTVRFVAFVNEEPPFFYWGKMGSMVYAQLAKQRGDNIRFMVSLETIGFYSNEPGSQIYPPIIRHFYPEIGNFIAFVSNLRSRNVMKKAVRAFQAVSDFPIEHLATLAVVPGVAWSDHLSFWRQGYKAFMVTDTAFYRYPYYHTPQDTPDKLTYEAYAKMCDGLLHMLIKLSANR